jgi:hypothetical protein
MASVEITCANVSGKEEFAKENGLHAAVGEYLLMLSALKDIIIIAIIVLSSKKGLVKLPMLFLLILLGAAKVRSLRY